MISKRVLLVEDDPAILRTMATLLEIEGHTVLRAANGVEGIEQIQSSLSRPDLILLDMMMPVMDGWGFLDFIRNNAETAKIPVVIVSAYTEIAKSVRPHAYVAKPFQLETLLETIESISA